MRRALPACLPNSSLWLEPVPVEDPYAMSDDIWLPCLPLLGGPSRPASAPSIGPKRRVPLQQQPVA